jgi:endonuclease-8
VPEGDTIWRTAAALQPRLAGRTVRRASHVGLEGRRIESVEAVGKHLLIRFDGGWVLRTHMGMTGVWYVHRPGERWRKPAWRARVVLEVDDWVAVCFSAPTVELSQDARQALRNLGPDLLADVLDLDEVVRRARSVDGAVAMGELLLDQRVCCGIGNVYRCETLWARGIDPWRRCRSVSDEELRAVYAYAREAMRGNLQGAGRTFPGHRRAAVHGRRGRPCPTCGTAIATRRQGDLARWTYFCPTCQR